MTQAGKHLSCSIEGDGAPCIRRQAGVSARVTAINKA